MGNPDKVVIFNKNFGIVVRGSKYNQEPEVVEIALKQFQEEAKANIEEWNRMQKEHPEMVEENYNPNDYLNITCIEVYDLHLH